MLRRLLVILLLIGIACRATGQSTPVEQRLTRERDSLQTLLNYIRSYPKRAKPPVKEKPAKRANALAQKPEDTAYFYYKDALGKVSLKISPWVNGRRKLLFYSKLTGLTYTQGDVRMSFSDISEVMSWHPNGAVAELKTHTNPGASRYWYETVTRFSNLNEPEWQTHTQFPQDHVEIPGGNDYYWDKKTETWKKQEVMDGQPIK